MLALLDRLEVEDSALILLAGRDMCVERSARNIPGVKTLRANYLNLQDLLSHEWLVIPKEALPVIEEFLG